MNHHLFTVIGYIDGNMGQTIHDDYKKLASPLPVYVRTETFVTAADLQRTAEKKPEPRGSGMKDFSGREAFEGDTIQHPDGNKGVVFYDEAWQNCWRVRYSDGTHSALGLQLTEKGGAFVVGIKP